MDSHSIIKCKNTRHILCMSEAVKSMSSFHLFSTDWLKRLVYFGTFKKSIFIFLHFSKVYVSKNTEQATLIKFR